jgi:peptidoglycan DL-endopeptidase RipA
MKRFYSFAIGLAILVAPVVTTGLAAADPGARPMDYQQATDAVVMRGLSQRGVPFSWAGGGVTGPSRGKGTGITTVGFDASGLMQYAYAGAGIKLPRSSGEMYRLGQKVMPQQAQKGDLIFYGPEGTQSVAMYLGNGQMLEVGDVVQVSPVRSNGMTPYLVRVLGAQSAPVQQAPLQQDRPSRPRCSKYRPSRPRCSRYRPSKRRCSKYRPSKRHCNRYRPSKRRYSRYRPSRRRCNRLRSVPRGNRLAGPLGPPEYRHLLPR